MAEISTLNGYKIKDKKAIRFYDTVADMVADITLKNGMHVKTSGYYQVYDGGDAEYKITNDNNLIADNGSVIALDNDLFAKLIINNNTINAKQFGAYANNENDDTGSIQSAINYCIKNEKNLYIDEGSYKINSSLNIPTGYNNFSINGSGLDKTILYYYGNDSLFDIDLPRYNFSLTNMKLYGISDIPDNETKVIQINECNNSYFARSEFKNLFIYHFFHGLNLMDDDNNNYPDGIIIDNVRFNNVERCITLWRADTSTISNCYAEGYSEYFLYTYQAQTLKVFSCIVNGWSNNNTHCVGFIVSGTASKGYGVEISNISMENTETIAILSARNTYIHDIFYTVDYTPTNPTFYIAKSGGVDPDNNKIERVKLVYEELAPTYNVSVIGSDTTISYGRSLSFNAQYTNASNIEFNGINIFTVNFNNNNAQLLKLVNGNSTQILTNTMKSRVFYVSSTFNSSSATAPDGTSWLVGDLVLLKQTSNYNLTVGYQYQKTGSSTNELVPFGFGIEKHNKNSLNAYSGLYVGQQAFCTDNLKPVWWNGSNWTYSDGTVLS